MAQTTKIVMVKTEITTWKCDFCDTETDNNRGCCGSRMIQTCSFCDKDACRKHREAYFENEWTQDYPDFFACEDCIDKVNKCEHIAHDVAERYDDWWEVVKKIYDNFNEYESYLDDYEPKNPVESINMEELYEK